MHNDSLNYNAQCPLTSLDRCIIIIMVNVVGLERTKLNTMTMVIYLYACHCAEILIVFASYVSINTNHNLATIRNYHLEIPNFIPPRQAGIHIWFDSSEQFSISECAHGSGDPFSVCWISAATAFLLDYTSVLFEQFCYIFLCHYLPLGNTVGDVFLIRPWSVIFKDGREIILW